MKPLKELLRPNILSLSPYSCARDEYKGTDAKVFLDANESPYNAPLNRYPDPLQRELKTLLAKIKNVHEENIFLGNGSDEAIDLIYRCFANPGKDNVVAMEPTYGMYKVCADINDVEYRPVFLQEAFKLSASKILAACDNYTKVIWICSPNNPTGNSMERKEVETLLKEFEGLVVVDEAYADFSTQKSFRFNLQEYPNLIVLQTMSKAWGCAAIRLGMAFADKEIIETFNKVKYPYNVNFLTQQKAQQMLQEKSRVENWVKITLEERTRMTEAFKKLKVCRHVYPSDANFFLAKMTDAQAIYEKLMNLGIIVRNRSRVVLCEDCLRITIGTKSENDELLKALQTL